eukprot:TRINITY_DN2010_c0_g1_i2.p1 TRINITY_DN2010_c0_g1~~TRINITY_DN2010_c0_g1_i2.p1  ORF type:complete len:310 (-),score=14.54 TRINITY_DN2010_c0_g1_i2:65-994(-)
MLNLFQDVCNQYFWLIVQNNFKMVLVQTFSKNSVLASSRNSFCCIINTRKQFQRAPIRVQLLQPKQVFATLAPLKQSNIKTQQLNEQDLKSTLEHKAWVTFGGGVMLGMIAVGFGQCSSMTDYSTCIFAFIAAFILADAGTGFYHWGVDNYGGPSTPLFGKQIAAFQGHHKEPWTITQREFCNNVHQVFKPASFLAVGFLFLSPFAPSWFDVWAGSMFIFACMSQQFHSWAHMKKSELPPVIIALQDTNILIGRKSHGTHHRPPFINNYCIVSGWWNTTMDGPSLEKSVYRKLENFFFPQHYDVGWCAL